jgi:nucleoid-associated protein YgaU
MGKPEKLVVLTLLFGAAIVLALALTRSGDEVEAQNPLSGAQRVLELGDTPAGTLPPDAELPQATGEEAPAAAESPAGTVSSSQTGGGAPPSLLLNAGEGSERESALDSRLVSEPASTLALEPESDPTKRILSETAGLRPSFLEDYMMYTVAEGDTWSSLAQRFYRDGRFTRNLHLANEDLEELAPGKDILVPVYDFIARDAGLLPGPGAAPLAERAAEAPPSTSTITSTSTGAVPAVSGKPLEYEVRYGDTLSDISLAVFGNATRWKEILEANRDKLQRPESLQVGMKLKIPEGGKLPVASSKKPEAKPKTTSQTEKTASTSKKKKVL